MEYKFKSITISIPGFVAKKIMELEKPVDCLGVYFFYNYAAGWQKTNQPYCTNPFTADGLKMDLARVEKARKLLIDAGLITTIKTRRKCYTKINYILKHLHIGGALDIPEQQDTKDKNTNDKVDRKHPDKGGALNEVKHLDIGGSNACSIINNNIEDSSIRDTDTKQDEKESSYFDTKRERKNTLLGSYELTYPKEIDDILEEVIKVGGFSNHLRHKYKNPKTKQFTKTFEGILSIIKELYEGDFYGKRKWDPGWVKKQKITYTPPKGGYGNYDHLKKVLLWSAARAGIARKGGLESVPESLLDFFYNPMTSKSRFLYFLNNQVMSESEQLAKGQLSQLPEKVQEITEAFYRKHANNPDEVQGRVTFYNCMNRVYTWYIDNREEIYLYNKAYRFDGFSGHYKHPEWFFAILLNTFMEKMYEEEREQDHEDPKKIWHVRFPDCFPGKNGVLSEDSSQWRGFCNWILEYRDISIYTNNLPSIKEMKKEITDQKRGSYERVIASKITKLKQFATEHRIDPDSIPMEEWRKKAIKEIEERK